MKCALSLATLVALAGISTANLAQASDQVSRESFTRALGRNAAYRKAAGMMPGPAHWIDGSSKLWFAESDGTVFRYVLYDAKTRERSALEKAKIAEAVNLGVKGKGATGKGEGEPVDADKLELRELQFESGATGFGFELRHSRWHCTLPGYACTREEPGGGEDDWSRLPGFEGNDAHKTAVSPDGKWRLRSKTSTSSCMPSAMPPRQSRSAAMAAR